MVRSRRPAVQRYHDRVAARYDRSYDDAFWRWHDALTWDYLKPWLPRNANAEVLDLGCGTGKWAAKLAKSGYAVTLVDISAKMLDQSREKLAKQGGLSRCTFIQADLCDLSELPAERFGLAVAFGDPIGCTHAPGRALREIHRLLTPDAHLVATFDQKLAAIDFYLESKDPKALARFLRDGKTHWLTKNTDERFELSMFTPSELVKLLADAGFEISDLVGKTVLPMRYHRQLLEDSSASRRWAKVEKSLCRDPAAVGRASHIQVACRPKPGGNVPSPK